MLGKRTKSRIETGNSKPLVGSMAEAGQSQIANHKSKIARSPDRRIYRLFSSPPGGGALRLPGFLPLFFLLGRQEFAHALIGVPANQFDSSLRLTL